MMPIAAQRVGYPAVGGTAPVDRQQACSLAERMRTVEPDLPERGPTHPDGFIWHGRADGTQPLSPLVRLHQRQAIWNSLSEMDRDLALIECADRGLVSLLQILLAETRHHTHIPAPRLFVLEGWVNDQVQCENTFAACLHERCTLRNVIFQGVRLRVSTLNLLKALASSGSQVGNLSFLACEVSRGFAWATQGLQHTNHSVKSLIWNDNDTDEVRPADLGDALRNLFGAWPGIQVLDMKFSSAHELGEGDDMRHVLTGLPDLAHLRIELPAEPDAPCSMLRELGHLLGKSRSLVHLSLCMPRLADFASVGVVDAPPHERLRQSWALASTEMILERLPSTATWQQLSQLFVLLGRSSLERLTIERTNLKRLDGAGARWMTEALIGAVKLHRLSLDQCANWTSLAEALMDAGPRLRIGRIDLLGIERTAPDIEDACTFAMHVDSVQLNLGLKAAPSDGDNLNEPVAMTRMFEAAMLNGMACLVDSTLYVVDPKHRDLLLARLDAKRQRTVRWIESIWIRSLNAIYQGSYPASPDALPGPLVQLPQELALKIMSHVPQDLRYRTASHLRIAQILPSPSRQ